MAAPWRAVELSLGGLLRHRFRCLNPDPREDLESRSPNLGPLVLKGTLSEPPVRDLLFASSRESGKKAISSRRLAVGGRHSRGSRSVSRCRHRFGGCSVTERRRGEEEEESGQQ